MIWYRHISSIGIVSTMELAVCEEDIRDVKRTATTVREDNIELECEADQNFFSKP